MRRTPALLLCTLAALVAVGWGAAPANATAYRYWSYWKWSGSAWVYSNVGPSGSLQPGDVIGWRFATQANSREALAPRTDGDNATLCAAGPGIGVVIDYGVAQDAPSGESPPRSTPRGFCATKSDDRNGYRATAEHASERVNGSGLVCGIDGYPKTECGAQVSSPKSPTPTPKASASHHRHHHTPPRASAAPSRGATAPVPTQTADGTVRTSRPPGTSRPHPAASSRPDRGLPTALVSPLALDVDPTSPAPAKGGGAPVGLIVGVVIAAGLGGGAVWQFRRRA